MHDLDRTQAEYEAEVDDLDEGELEFGEEEETDVFGDTESDNPLSEADEIDLASELLTVSDDAELDQFLGSLFKKVARTVRKVAKAPVFRSLRRMARPFIKRALPIAGGALGGFFGGPAGAAIGSRLARFGGKAFGLELEGLSPEDAELEVARRVVRLTGEAAKNAALASPTAPPHAVAKAAMVAAARKHAPGLVRDISAAPAATSGWNRSGRWFRRGRKIIVVGA